MFDGCQIVLDFRVGSFFAVFYIFDSILKLEITI